MTDNLVELNLAGLDLEELPEEVLAFVHLRSQLGEIFDREETTGFILGNQLTSVPPELGQLANLRYALAGQQSTDQRAAGTGPTRQL